MIEDILAPSDNDDDDEEDDIVDSDEEDNNSNDGSDEEGNSKYDDDADNYKCRGTIIPQVNGQNNKRGDGMVLCTNMILVQTSTVRTVQRTRNGVSTTASVSSVSDSTHRGGTGTPGGGRGVGGSSSAGQVIGGGGRANSTAGPAGDCDSASGTGTANHLSTHATGRSSQDGASGGTVTTSERTSSSSRTGSGARSNRDRYGGRDLGPMANSDDLLEDQTHVLLPRRVAENNKQIKVLKERIQGYGKKGFLTYIRDTERRKAILAKQTRRSRGSSGQPEEEEEEDHQLTTRAYMESCIELGLQHSLVSCQTLMLSPIFWEGQLVLVT
jgi:hypothetical protein